MPLPDVAVESHLAVDLELVHVQLFAEELHDGLDHARMARELRERVAVQVRGEVRAHGVAALLAHVLRPALGVQARDLVEQGFDLFRLEQAREEKITVALEILDLLRVKLHRGILCQIPTQL